MSGPDCAVSAIPGLQIRPEPIRLDKRLRGIVRAIARLGQAEPPTVARLAAKLGVDPDFLIAPLADLASHGRAATWVDRKGQSRVALIAGDPDDDDANPTRRRQRDRGGKLKLATDLGEAFDVGDRADPKAVDPHKALEASEAVEAALKAGKPSKRG